MKTHTQGHESNAGTKMGTKAKVPSFRVARLRRAREREAVKKKKRTQVKVAYGLLRNISPYFH